MIVGRWVIHDPCPNLSELNGRVFGSSINMIYMFHPPASASLSLSLHPWVDLGEKLNRKPARFSHEDHGMFL